MTLVLKKVGRASLLILSLIRSLYSQEGTLLAEILNTKSLHQKFKLDKDVLDFLVNNLKGNKKAKICGYRFWRFCETKSLESTKPKKKKKAGAFKKGKK